jgi:hypothetical protein
MSLKKPVVKGFSKGRSTIYQYLRKEGVEVKGFTKRKTLK